MHPRLLLLSLILISVTATSSPSAFAEAGTGGDMVVRMVKPGQEQFERDVDAAALSAQEKSISKLQGLLKKHRGSRQEPVFLIKLSEILQQTASIRFRLAHATAHGTKAAIDMNAYRKTMRQSISTLSELIAKYPHYEDMPQAYFMRGKGYEEIGEILHATQDYLHLVKTFPDAQETITAYMSLADFAINENNHAKALEYLSFVEKHPEDAHYPYALYKMAWANYNLKKIPTALSYIERHVAYYNAKIKDEGPVVEGSVTSDTALRENSLMDATVFYMEGFEQKLGSYGVDDALAYFKKLHDGPSLGKMLVRYSKLLRSHGHEAEVLAWKDEVLKKESQLPESLEVVLTTYEMQLNKRRYKELIGTSRDIVAIHKEHPKFDQFPRAQKLLTDTAEGLQQVLIKNKGADELPEMSATLATIYEAFTQIVDDSDPRIPRVHYNLAETLFEIKQFDQATVHYRWVVEHGKWNAPVGKDKTASVPDASLKAISSRYEVLRAAKLIPVDLAARKMPEKSADKLDLRLTEWIDWIDTHVGKTKDPIDNFAFEANRAMYLHGMVKEAVERLTKFALKNPTSKYAVPSASLALDTFIASENWEKSYDLSSEFIDVKAWKTMEFGKRLQVVASDSSYKMMELKYREKDFKKTASLADDFMKKFPSSARVAETLTLAGNSALELGDKAKASVYFTRLIKEVPNSAGVGHALMARASMAEERYQFSDAARDYLMYLSLPASVVKPDEKEAARIRAKALVLSYMSGDPAEMKAALANKTICNEALARECDRYEAMSQLEKQSKSPDDNVTEAAFDRSRKGFAENKAIWAALALEGTKSLPFRDRNVMLRQLATGWEDVDPLLKMTLVPYISRSVPKSFELNRLAMKDVAPLRADEKYITRRIEVIREMENAATKILKEIPWQRVRSLTLNEIASLYVDLAKGLSSLKAPKSLPESELAGYEMMMRKITIPFEEKGQDMRNKAYEIASRFSIEEESFFAVANPFFEDNPSLAKKLKPRKVPAHPEALGIALLQKLDPSGDWDDLNEKTDKPAQYLKSRWASAFKARHWQQVAFFLQEAREKKLLPAGTLGLMKAVSLAGVGAQGEALAEMQEALKDMQEKPRYQTMRFLISCYVSSFARDKAEDLINTIFKTNPDMASEIRSGVQWADDKPPLNQASTTHANRS